MRATAADLAERLCAAARRLDSLGLVPARDGNVSARLGPNAVLISRTGVRKGELAPGDLVEVDLAGTVRRGSVRPSTEAGLHLALYRLREDVQAVMHAHPPTAVGFASAGMGLTECLMPEVAVNLGSVPLTPYATPGTPELEDSVIAVARNHDAFLLANHGAVTMGGDVEQALDRMETLEHFARITLVARLLGGSTPLPASALGPLEAIRRRAGNPLPVTCEPAPDPSPRTEDPGTADLVRRIVAAVRAALDREAAASR